MSALMQALSKLDHMVGKLEGATDTLEHTLEGQQRDMFAANQAAAANGNGHVQPAVIAERLDNAIEKVEGLLEEG